MSYVLTLSVLKCPCRVMSRYPCRSQCFIVYDTMTTYRTKILPNFFQRFLPLLMYYLNYSNNQKHKYEIVMLIEIIKSTTKVLFIPETQQPVLYNSAHARMFLHTTFQNYLVKQLKFILTWCGQLHGSWHTT